MLRDGYAKRCVPAIVTTRPAICHAELVEAWHFDNSILRRAQDDMLFDGSE